MAVDTTAYIPLATSPASERSSEEDIHFLLKRRGHLAKVPAFVNTRRRQVVAAALAFLLILAAFSSIPRLTSRLKPIDLDPQENPYFHTGAIWDHNDEVAARLDRCSSLGLLRNTSLPIAPEQRPTPAEEAEFIAQGCGTNETTVVILASLWFAEAYSGTSNAGESIYAQSVISTLNAYNYSYVFSSLGWWNDDMKKSVELWHRHRWNVRMVLADPGQVNVCWDPKHHCMKSPENPEGIEAWRLMSFWYWDDPGNPLGPQFTLSPFTRTPNTLLSMSIEPTCRRLPIIPHADRKPPQAWLLAKNVKYLDNTDAFSWTIPALVDLQREFGIRVVGGMKNDDEETYQIVKQSGISNVGKLDKIEFYEELAKSSILIGVGRPRISPSPYDALCMGVPFINPILTWDEDDPLNRTKWHAQQWHMSEMEPPYVYNVHAHDLVELRRAVHSALTNPIESYIPEVMTFEWVCNRMGEVIEGDWRAKAQTILDERIESGEGAIFVM